MRPIDSGMIVALSPFQLIEGLVFFAFAAVITSCALGVVVVRNPVHAVLLMVAAFFSSAALFVMQGAEFLGLLLIIVYVGAIAVLFLFVVMMLDIRVVAAAKSRRKHLPLAIVVAGLLLAELAAVVMLDTSRTPPAPQAIVQPSVQPSPFTAPFTAAPRPLLDNTTELGLLLYSDYLVIFEIAGLLLLLAMLGAIVLTHRKREGVARQDFTLQQERVEKARLVKVASVKVASVTVAPKGEG